VEVVVAVRWQVTVDQDDSGDGGAELVQAAEMLWRIAHDLQTSDRLSGAVVDRNGVATGLWAYTPTAPATQPQHEQTNKLANQRLDLEISIRG
jgi:hypothetical protein